jgi:hypothetical protein
LIISAVPEDIHRNTFTLPSMGMDIIARPPRRKPCDNDSVKNFDFFIGRNTNLIDCYITYTWSAAIFGKVCGSMYNLL